MTNRITVAPQGNGTQIWTNRDEATGDEIRYLLVPVSQIVVGDRIEDMPRFRPRADGKGLERVTEVGRGVLSQADINQFPVGSFVRMRAL